MPGEHHFVSVYLVPRLYELNRLVPDYVNPDGTKGIVGDVVYFKDGSHKLGIEVKLRTIRLTKTEFNNWIVAENESGWPDVFLGIGSKGVMVLTWTEFRDSYVRMVRAGNSAWSPTAITDGYGPEKLVNDLFPPYEHPSYFPKSTDSKQATELESRFLEALRRAINC